MRLGLRAAVISSIGLLVASFITTSGIDYHESRNVSLLGAPSYSLSIRLLLLVPITILAAVLVWKRDWGEGANQAGASVFPGEEVYDCKT